MGMPEPVGKSLPMTEEQLAAFGAELDAIRQEVMKNLGEEDARYIRRVARFVRATELSGRGLLMIGILPPAWLAGTALLGISKIVENMELGHNVMHGQYNWMNDPQFNSRAYEWDNVGTSDAWRRTHNVSHHKYTNIRGLDDDIGYGLLRLFPEQRWSRFYLGQPVYAFLLATLFEWGVAIQHLEFGAVVAGRKDRATFDAEWAEAKKKIVSQLKRDYVFFPLLAGPMAPFVFSGNLVANLIRNYWTFTVIFCGHFTADAELFDRSVLENETRGHFYLRQLRGSSNLTGGRVFHFMTGNLSHQIEHHLFPTMPARHYHRIAPRVRAICEKYGQHYNTGSLRRQFGQVTNRIFRHMFPSTPVTRPALTVA